jgi:hypothetical protein
VNEDDVTRTAALEMGADVLLKNGVSEIEDVVSDPPV